MKEKKLSNSPREYRLDILNANVSIYTSNIPNPIIKYNGSFDIVDSGSVLKIKQIFEKSKKGFSFKRFFGKQVVTINGCKIIKRGNSVTVLGNGGNLAQINGRTFFNGIEITDDMFDESGTIEEKDVFVGEPHIDLILPLNQNGVSIDLNLTTGDIDLRDLILDRLIVNNQNGDINLRDVDAVLAKIELINGDIRAEIAESMMNYVVSSNTVNGSLTQRTIERFDTLPELLRSKHNLNINSVNGDIDITFKGKSK